LHSGWCVVVVAGFEWEEEVRVRGAMAVNEAVTRYLYTHVK
jgi:hypothetical protein